jgi:hypothetical protein
VVHLQANGFRVDKKDTPNSELDKIKAKYGVPPQLSSCHTAVIQGYVIEGHVPADLIEQVLKEKPEAIGLAVPGMPIGSPGMEGRNPEPYNVYAFDRQGRVWVYARR